MSRLTLHCMPLEIEGCRLHSWCRRQPYRAPGEHLWASLAQLLNAAQVPCVLWGHVLLRIHGVPTIVGVSVPSPPLFFF
jgi:hypothetical protein